MSDGSAESDKDPKRSDRRVEAAFRVRYRSVDDLVVGYTKNLSRGGLFLRTEKLLAIGTPVKLHIELPDGGGEIEAACRVAFIRDAAEAARTALPRGMGIQFVDAAEAVRSRIEGFIADCSTPAPVAERPSRALRVLVVDDDASYCEVAAEPFRRRGDSVRIAHDGLEGLARCLEETPDVILSDVTMPRMDGWQFLRLVRARPALLATPFVFLTTLASEDDRMLGYRLGVDDYIAKPYRPEEVVARADRAVSRAQTSNRGGAEGQKSLRGDLEQVSVASVLSFLELDKRTGVLRIAGPRTLRVHLRDGTPVRIVVEGSSVAAPGGPKALFFEALEWTSGSFELSADSVTGPDDVGAKITSLLLEHARRRDERAR